MYLQQFSEVGCHSSAEPSLESSAWVLRGKRSVPGGCRRAEAQSRVSAPPSCAPGLGLDCQRSAPVSVPACSHSRLWYLVRDYRISRPTAFSRQPPRAVASTALRKARACAAVSREKDVRTPFGSAQVGGGGAAPVVWRVSSGDCPTGALGTWSNVSFLPC